MAFHRNVMERFGPLPPEVTMCDKALTNRALALGGVGLIKDRLVRYRLRADGVTTWLTAWSVARELLRKKLSDYVANSEGLRSDLKHVGVEATEQVQKKLGAIEDNLATEERMLRATLAFPSGHSVRFLLAQLWRGDQHWRQFALRCLVLAIDPPRHEMWLRFDPREITTRAFERLRRGGASEMHGG